jgi:quercetin dioxygenase-like cupin family protein
MMITRLLGIGARPLLPPQALVLLLSALVLLPLRVAPARAAEGAPIYANLQGEVVLENARAQVEKFVLEPGASTGRHSHPADQLLVFIKGGVLKSVDSGRSTVWRDGRVVWHSAGEPADGGSINVGSKPIEMIWVTVKPVPPEAAAADSGWGPEYHLNYQNIPGEDLLENHRLVVQRFLVAPGQWEGVHAHRPNMLWIHVKGGLWSERTYQQPEKPDSPVGDGSVGWMRIIPISVGHESHNRGTEPIDLIWVTFKD